MYFLWMDQRVLRVFGPSGVGRQLVDRGDRIVEGRGTKQSQEEERKGKMVCAHQ